MRYWIGVASRQHVLRGISEGICQVCHGKGRPLQQMAPNDWIIYYSPTEVFGEQEPCRRFTAIGQIEPTEPYTVTLSTDFTPWRRDVTFYPGKEVAIEPLIGQLSFIKDPRRWGFPFRRGCFAIPYDDFRLIAEAMGVSIE